MDQAETLRRVAALKRGQGPGGKSSCEIISVSSGKGGVGKSNITVNLAVTLAKRGRKVLMLDADMGTANIDILLGMDPRRNLSHVIEGQATLLEILVKVTDNLYLIPGASGIMDAGYLPVQQLDQLRTDLLKLEEMFDFMFIDTAAGVNNLVIRTLQGSDRILMICTDEPTSIVDAYALAKVLFRECDAARLQLVVNDVEGEEEAEDVYGKLKVAIQHFLKKELEYLSYIVHDDVVARGVVLQKPFMLTPAECPARANFEALATLLDHDDPWTEGKGFLQLFQLLVQK
ncbi:MinD/ParA family protein [Sulfidibacter corallicola]|uniref:MinD/ParA family protein n=1 Tax=Sulfidibacter corallicola TaxID=2818388 RepID=A0A8A4TR24_SULCO|nr:MinD/ParA family protein [Sulfidibacter corallicola]QTD52426.1 MinD/ParA family protein [Sulfidibacter corallicola]